MTGIKLSPEVEQSLREHELQVDLQILRGVFESCPWIKKLCMEHYDRGYVRGYASTVWNHKGEEEPSHKLKDDLTQTIRNKGFRGYPLLKELTMERVEGGFTYTLTEY